MLAIVGDQSGLERMRKDIVEFTKNDPPERGSEAYEKTFPMGLRTKGGRLGFALSAAKVLVLCPP